MTISQMEINDFFQWLITSFCGGLLLFIFGIYIVFLSIKNPTKIFYIRGLFRWDSFNNYRSFDFDKLFFKVMTKDFLPNHN